jgi:hypothetical protein
MNATQPQLLQIPLDPGDVVYTPDWVARDMVEYFKPTGRILEPCAGDGAFMKYLPTADWCEITKGRDFFACHEHYDWIVGNPPYRIFGKWLDYSMTVADNIVYLIPTNKPFYGWHRLRNIFDWGGMPILLEYGSARNVGFDFGFSIAAVHFRRGYTGPINVVFRGKP